MKLVVRLAGFGEPLRRPDFRLVWIAHTTSALGDRAAPVGLAFGVLALSRSPIALGGVLAAQVAPTVALVLVGGVVADRVSARRAMILSNGVQAVAQGLSAYVLLSGSGRLWELAALQVVYGVGDALLRPASTAIVADVADPRVMQNANALLSLSRSVSKIAGPALAGVIVAGFGPGAALAVDAGSFVVSGACLLSMAPEAAPRKLRGLRLAQEARAGWREFVSRPWTWVSVAHFSVFQALGLAPFMVLGPLVATRSLHGASGWAIVLGAAGVGSIVGAVTGLAAEPPRPLLAAFCTILLWVPQLVLLGLGASLVAVAAAAVVAAAGLALANIYWYTALQENVPRAALARVSAYDHFGSLLLYPIGLFGVGALAAATGAETALLACAAIVVAITAAVLAIPSVRALPRAVTDSPDATVPGDLQPSRH